MGRDKIEDDMRKRHDPDLSEDAWNKRIELKNDQFLKLRTLTSYSSFSMKFSYDEIFCMKIPKISNSD